MFMFRTITNIQVYSPVISRGKRGEPLTNFNKKLFQLSSLIHMYFITCQKILKNIEISDNVHVNLFTENMFLSEAAAGSILMKI